MFSDLLLEDLVNVERERNELPLSVLSRSCRIVLVHADALLGYHFSLSS